MATKMESFEYGYKKGYEKGIKRGRDLAGKEEFKWLLKNRNIIDGVDVLDVDKRMKELKRREKEK
jgi:hypothetical protein